MARTRKGRRCAFWKKPCGQCPGCLQRKHEELTQLELLERFQSASAVEVRCHGQGGSMEAANESSGTMAGAAAGDEASNESIVPMLEEMGDDWLDLFSDVDSTLGVAHTQAEVGGPGARPSPSSAPSHSRATCWGARPAFREVTVGPASSARTPGS